VTVILDSVPSGKVNFAIIIENEYIEFYPNDWKQFNNYDLTITLTDGIMSSPSFPFKLTMTNTAPTLQTKLPAIQKVQLSKEFNLALPAVLDMENNPIIVANLQMPSFIMFDATSTTFVIKPTNPATDLGMFNVKG